MFEKIIIGQVRRDKNIIYGARSINAQTMPMFKRKTQDWDIYSNSPRNSAKKLERSIDNKYGNISFIKPAEHPGTFKVKGVGRDRTPNTKDDISIADFTKQPNNVKFRNINGIRYSRLEDERKNKQRSLKYKKYGFRHAKDYGDIASIDAGSYSESFTRYK